MQILLKNILLGLVQGLTEFLPVSSSGHLVIARHLLHIRTGAFEEVAFLHLATLLSILFYFRKDLYSLIVNFFRKKGITERKTVWFLFAASVPAGIAGFLLKPSLDRLFSQDTVWISVFFLYTAALLVASDYVKKKEARHGFLNSLVIGLFQAVSILPGVSRSGSTITGAIFCGLERRFAVLFSFYMSIPAILFGNVLFASYDKAFFTLPEIAGFLTAFFSGLLAIDILMKLVRKAKLRFFGFYALAAAVVNLFII